MRYTGNHLFSNKDNNPQKKKYYHYTVDYSSYLHERIVMRRREPEKTQSDLQKRYECRVYLI